jgi:predicted transcriptional regulator of viral defense system
MLFLAFYKNGMNYLTFREIFKDFTVIALADIFGVDPHFHRRRLNDWQDKGYLTKIIKGYYRLSDTPLDENSLFETANRIYGPSYISVEMALSYYGFIPEAVYGITSVATRPTKTFATPIGTFIYQTIKPGLFFGYRIEPYGTHKHFALATPEKAVLDYLYLRPALTGIEDFASLRVDPETIRQKARETDFFAYLARFENQALSRRATLFWNYLKHA